MKKFLTLLVIILITSNNSFAQDFWSNTKDGPASVEAAKKIFSGRKLDYIEGIWFDDGLGSLVIFKDEDIYKMYIISGNTDFDGTWEASFIKRGERQYDFFQRIWYSQSDGSYKFDTQAGKVNALNNHFYTRYDSTSNTGGDMDSKYTRVWPQDLNAYNNSLNISEDQKNETNKEDRDDDFDEKFYALNWYNLENSKNHDTEIPTSNSTVNILESEIYLKGEKDINEYSMLLFESEDYTQDMFIKGDNYSIYIDYINEGYTSLEDWKDVDPKELLEGMKSTAKEDVKTVTWLVEPKILENTIVTYSYKVEWIDSKDSIETRILTLGRKGHNDISLVASQENFSVTELEKLAIEFAKTIIFEDGFAYADYKSGDKVAALGIGGLVAGTLGIKVLAKVGILAKLLPLLKSFWWIIIAPIVIVANMFKGNSDNNQKNTNPKKTINRRKKKD